jgi:hypothetical protein
MERHLGVRYVFDTIGGALTPETTAKPPDSPHLAASMRRLPETLRAELREAVELSDTARIDEAMAAIRTEDAALAEALAKLSSDFAYDRILALFQPSAT